MTEPTYITCVSEVVMGQKNRIYEYESECIAHIIGSVDDADIRTYLVFKNNPPSSRIKSVIKFESLPMKRSVTFYDGIIAFTPRAAKEIIKKWKEYTQECVK